MCSIGVEIVHQPDNIFLDEPTTGLDSSTSLEVIGAVKSLADQNRTIVVTIHQPSTNLYAEFDNLVLVSVGRILYSGAADSVLEYFSKHSLSSRFSPGTNPADAILVLAIGEARDDQGNVISPQMWAKLYDDNIFSASTSSDAITELRGALELDGSDGKNNADEKQLADKHCATFALWMSSDIYPTSTWNQFKVLLHREIAAVRNHPKVFVASIIR